VHSRDGGKKVGHELTKIEIGAVDEELRQADR
jgi:hypothetical protein